MKHKYNIKIDPPVPTDAQIGSHKDFGRILADYHNLTQPIYRVPLYKNPKAFIGLVLILAIAGLVFWQVEKDDKEQEKQKELAELPTEVRLAEQNSYLKPPVATLAVPTETIEIDPAKPQEITLQNGAVLSLSANALGLPDGTVAKGAVQLHVRQVRSVAELIALGLPMQVEDRLIIPTDVVEVHATLQQGAQETELTLLNNANVKIELPVAGDALQTRLLYNLDDKTRTWHTTADGPIQSHPRNSNRAAIDPHDGFGVVEYDSEGKVVPKPKVTPKPSDKPIQVLQFYMPKLGITCLGESVPQPSGSVPHHVRFTDIQGQPLRLLTLYGLVQGRNAVEFLWPKTADYAFDLHTSPNRDQSYLGFLPDGRLASVKGVATLPETQEVQVLQMQVTAAPVKDIQELTQLIASMSGL